MIMEARVQALVVGAYAIQAEIEGMNADNLKRSAMVGQLPFESGAYNDKAQQLHGIAFQLEQLGRE